MTALAGRYRPTPKKARLRVRSSAKATPRELRQARDLLKAVLAPQVIDLPPEPGPQLHWRAGISPGNTRFRVTLNGEPVAGAVEARASGPASPGWAKLYDGKVVRGDVRIVEGDRS